MSIKRKRIDTKQAALDFDGPIQQYEDLRVKLLRGSDSRHIDSYEEACIEVAATVKSTLRASGMSREELVDAINDYFGSTGKSKHRLSIHMFNHYLSKPTLYPMPAVLIFAIQHVTGSLETISAFAKAEEARVITGEEVRKLAIGKLDDAIAEMQRLKKEFRGIKR